jgi:exodeoxyribonuclease VII large subunit
MRSNSDTARKVYTVVELTRLVKSTIEGRIGTIWVEGELSNVRKPSSGHLYFTLKDESSQISAVMFRGDQRGLKFQPADGILACVLGDLSVYERHGNYQIIVRRMEEWGKGALQAKFDALKEKLLKEGLFDESRKKKMPLLPRHIGVVTSPTGAAVRDILNIISRRFRDLHVVLAPVRVQGEGASEEIAAAIDLLNERGGLDVLIVTRGGGSLEDLWCFNEETVARAIARSQLPVISAVGHEIDFSISDFVADLRAPTPSAAAELVVEKKTAFEARLQSISGNLARALREYALKARSRLVAAGRSYVFREPQNLVERYRGQLETLGIRTQHRATAAFRERQQQVDDLTVRMLHHVRMLMHTNRQDVRRLGLQLKALSPLAVLDRGYSITRGKAGQLLRSVEDVHKGDSLSTQLADGMVTSDVVASEKAPAKKRCEGE